MRTNVTRAEARRVIFPPLLSPRACLRGGRSTSPAGLRPDDGAGDSLVGRVLVELLLIAVFDGLPARGELRFEAQRVRVDRAEERGALGALERVAGERHAL